MAILDFLFGRTKPTPTTTTVQQTSKLPEEIAPFVTEVLGEAQQLYGQRKAEGYKEFPGETIAPRTAEELAAREGLRGLVGTQEPYRAEAEQMIRATPTQFTAEEAQRLMSPYQRAVTDIEKREAQRAFERDVQPALEARAIGAGGMSGLGTRAAVQAAEAQRAQSQLLADIEAKGQQRAFEQAYRQFGDETALQRQRAFDIGETGTQRFNIGLAERGLQQQLGQEDRAEAQALLNEQFAEFLEREQFPESTLAQYSSFVYGNPFLRTPDTTRTTSGTLQPTTSMGQQLLGLGLTGLSTFGAGTKGSFNLSDFSLGNIFRKGGGSVAGGLASLPVINRQAGTRVGISPIVARTIRSGLPRPADGREGERKLNQAAIARQAARRKAIEQAGRKYITDADKIAQETIANQKAALMKQFEGVDTFSGPTGEAMKALYAPGVETKGLVGALNVALPAFMSERSKIEQERKTKEAEIEAENIALQRAASLATVEQENKLADKLSNAQEKIDEATTQAEKDDATYEARMAAADLNAIKIATDIHNSILDSKTANIKALADKAKLGKIDRNDAKTVRQIVAGQFGYVFDDEGLKIGGNVLDSTDERLVEFERVAERVLDKLRDTGKDFNAAQKEARIIAEERQERALIESGDIPTLGNDGKIPVVTGRGRRKKTVMKEPQVGQKVVRGGKIYTVKGKDSSGRLILDDGR
tara:strand:+ start:9 stop:2114 length:2106 start_codon:yes stop_codon:yes gene_type:complete